MTKVLTLATRAILSLEKSFNKITASAGANDAKATVNGDKFFIDSNGSVVLNRYNSEVQKAFAANIKGLSSKKKG